MSDDQQKLIELEKELQKEIEKSISLKRQIEEALKHEAALDAEIAKIKNKKSQVRERNRKLQEEINIIKKEILGSFT